MTQPLQMRGTKRADLGALGLKLVEWSVEERAEKIEATQWCSEFSWDEIVKVSHHMTAYKAEKELVLFQEGDKEEYMGLIVKGKITIAKKSPSGEYHELAQLSPGKTFGEMSLFDGEPRSARAKLSEGTVILTFAHKDLEDLVAKNSTLALKLIKKFIRLMSSYLRNVSGKLAESLGD